MSDKLSKTDMRKQFEAFLNQDDANAANSDSAKRQAQCDFWMEYREIIGVNQQSQSFAVLDKIAEAILEGKAKEAMEEFGMPVLLLLHPARMTALKQAPDHRIFADHKSDSPPPSRDSSEKEESDDDEKVSNADEESSEEDEAETSRKREKTKGEVLLPREEEESDDDEVKPPTKRVRITAAKAK
ncbi:hypothetical protein PHMEG_00025726 [Phytophthora megakarya]|uniref:Uncharacterized protein n=1 Tax=Phytophthora megakarya TaxID=4795 RepID=A0A225VBD0_9STRA|nr:hypothetical protein PHMEG_00025726 [Phytophthora megakarya]